jgi:hypothetical protein
MGISSLADFLPLTLRTNQDRIAAAGHDRPAASIIIGGIKTPAARRSMARP